tara:strand:+ start:757 stop:1053 length:297 start_codon:yes stop_codon:yes gene_type:complete
MPGNPIRKRSVRLFGHLTSISIEEPFWRELQAIAAARNITMTGLIEQIDAERAESEDPEATGNLSSALRLYVLAQLLRERDERGSNQDNMMGMEASHG